MNSSKNSSKNTVRIQAKNTPRQQTNRALAPRNYLALNPLMQKGGIHESDDIAIARKRARRSCKQNLRQTDWLEELADYQSGADNSKVDYSQLELDRL